MMSWVVMLAPQADAIADTKVVLAAIVAEAKASKLRGDELADALVKAAARSARALPEKRRGPAFLVAIGVGLDRSGLMRATNATWRAVETEPERAARLKALGTPTLHGRHDLLQHFVVSAALTALSGAKTTETIGITKEWLDAQPGGSGFSFADLAADFAGVALAEAVLKDETRLDAVGKLADVTLPPRGLDEGLSVEAFEKAYGGLKDERFLKACARIKERLKTKTMPP